ncbi:unnamed protein product [Caenorhabditis sp. 36 PRJEB53466]|nr:unnamed protein product [Caenorhabditis sp. 36 PRJEB53466]
MLAGDPIVYKPDVFSVGATIFRTLFGQQPFPLPLEPLAEDQLDKRMVNAAGHQPHANHIPMSTVTNDDIEVITVSRRKETARIVFNISSRFELRPLSFRGTVKQYDDLRLERHTASAQSDDTPSLESANAPVPPQKSPRRNVEYCDAWCANCGIEGQGHDGQMSIFTTCVADKHRFDLDTIDGVDVLKKEQLCPACIYFHHSKGHGNFQNMVGCRARRLLKDQVDAAPGVAEHIGNKK